MAIFQRNRQASHIVPIQVNKAQWNRFSFGHALALKFDAEYQTLKMVTISILSAPYNTVLI